MLILSDTDPFALAQLVCYHAVHWAKNAWRFVKRLRAGGGIATAL